MEKKLNLEDLIYVGVFLIPFEYIIGENLYAKIILVLSILGFLINVRLKSKIYLNIYLIGYLLLILFAGFSTFYSKGVSSTYSILMKVTPYYVYCCMLSWTITKDNKNIINNINKVFMNFLVGTILVSTISIIKDLGEFNKYTRIGLSLFKNVHTMFTYYLLISFCISIWFYSIEKRKNKKILFMIISIMIYSISLFTAVRKAAIIPIVFFSIYNFFISSNRKNYLNAIFKILLIAVISVILYKILINNEYFASTIGRRMDSLLQSLKGVKVDENSINVRKELVSNAITCFKSYPILGYGFGAFRDYANQAIGIKLYAHNNYWELLSSCGILGFSIYYGSIVLVIKNLIKKLKYKKSKLYYFGLSLTFTLLINDLGVVSYLSINYMLILSIISYFSNINYEKYKF